MDKKIIGRIRRHNRIRIKISGNNIKPRLSIFRSNKHFYAQLIDDVKGKVILAVSEKELAQTGTKLENSIKLGELLAKKAVEKKIKNIVFDRGGFSYQGRVKSFAESVRKNGLIF